MKKFLCYDTNDAASGKVNVSTNGVLRPNSTVPSTNGTTYQQLVTDGNGNTKWEDRLAYVTGTVMTELVSEQTVTFSNMDGIMVAMFPSNFTAAEGDSYSVVFDGVTYECSAKSIDGTPCIGNASILYPTEADTEEPFFIASQGSKWITISTDISTEHVISISGIVSNIKKIDTKYVDLSGVSVLSVMPGGEWTYKKAKEILDSGKLPYIQMSADWLAFILLPCQNNTGFTSNDYITFASFISSEMADNYNYFSVAYLKLVKGAESADPNDVKIYDLPRSEHGDRVILNSSTSGSSKKFKITVDDSGAITATEV